MNTHKQISIVHALVLTTNCVLFVLIFTCFGSIQEFAQDTGVPLHLNTLTIMRYALPIGLVIHAICIDLKYAPRIALAACGILAIIALVCVVRVVWLSASGLSWRQS